MEYTLGSARAREGIGPEQAEPRGHATEVSGWEVRSWSPPLLRVGCSFLHGGPVHGGGWPWRLGGHLGGWEESPCEMGRVLSQSHEKGKVGVGLGTISQVADGMKSRC